MTKFTIPVPGNLASIGYGISHYAINKRDGSLAIVGIGAPYRIKKQYDFWFDEESVKKFGIDTLPRNGGEDDERD